MVTAQPLPTDFNGLSSKSGEIRSPERCPEAPPELVEGLVEGWSAVCGTLGGRA